MKRIVPGLLVLILWMVAAVATAADHEFGIETEVYPTGVITAITAKIPLEKPGR